MTAKRAAREAEYRKLKLVFLKENPVCQVCDKSKSIEPHHRRRRGIYLNDVSTWIPVCRRCHDRVETEVEWARERGLTVYDFEDWDEKNAQYQKWQESKLKHA